MPKFTTCNLQKKLIRYFSTIQTKIRQTKVPMYHWKSIIQKVLTDRTFVLSVSTFFNEIGETRTAIRLINRTHGKQKYGSWKLEKLVQNLGYKYTQTQNEYNPCILPTPPSTIHANLFPLYNTCIPPLLQYMYTSPFIQYMHTSPFCNICIYIHPSTIREYLPLLQYMHTSPFLHSSNTKLTVSR